MDNDQTLSSFLEELPISEVGHWSKEHIIIADTIDELVNPQSILEIGFNAGHSSAIFLHRTKANLISIDHLKMKCTQEGREILSQEFPNRFTFINSDSRSVLPQLWEYTFDLIFIDGGHSYDVCRNDLELAISLKIPYILIDDTNLKRVSIALEDFSKEHALIKIKSWPLRHGLMLFELKSYC